MKQEQYQSAVWLRTDGSGLIIGILAGKEGQGGLYFFDNSADAIHLFENLLLEMKNIVPSEDLTIPATDSPDTDKMVEALEKQYSLFCSGSESSARLKRVKTYKHSTAYRDCDYDDSIVGGSARRLGTINVSNRCFGDEPPEFITVRIADSVPMVPKENLG